MVLSEKVIKYLESKSSTLTENTFSDKFTGKRVLLLGAGPSTDDVKLLKNAPIPQGSSLEFMQGNKVVLETSDTITVSSDTNNSIDASLTIMEIT